MGNDKFKIGDSVKVIKIRQGAGWGDGSEILGGVYKIVRITTGISGTLYEIDTTKDTRYPYRLYEDKIKKMDKQLMLFDLYN